MLEFIGGSTFFSVTLTLAAFSVGLLCQKKWKSPLLSPIVLGAVIIILVLRVLDIPNATYQAGCQMLSYFLTPATICFAISFYEQLQKLKSNLAAIVLGVLAGTVCSLCSILLLCRALNLDEVLTNSLLPKSVTTAIGVALSEQIGGIAAITTAAIVITGTFGNIMGPVFGKWLNIKDPIALGVAFGTSAHVVGTSKASEIGQLCGAASSLSLTVAGILTTVALSFLTIL